MPTVGGNVMPDNDKAGPAASSIKAAMFAGCLRDLSGKTSRPYAGSVRYHLGLSTPNDDRCFIEVDRQRHSWRDGKPSSSTKLRSLGGK